MLKRSVVALSLVAIAASPALAQSPRGKAEVKLEEKAVTIDYGRPSLKGRDMLGKAQVGQSWRMGADAATSLTTEADLSFGEAGVPKGSYVLTAKKLGEDKWQLTVHESTPERSVVAEIPLETVKLEESVEEFTIKLSGEGTAGKLKMMWGSMALKTAFSAK